MRRADAQRAQGLFLTHLDTGVYTRWPVSRPHYATARDWLSLTALPLLTLDALHLAIAASQRVPIATSDADLARAAKGLAVATHLIRA